MAMLKVAVLGGGVSGLSTAYYLTKLSGITFQKILILESSSRLGGWINSRHLPDGTLFEAGPRILKGGGKAGHDALELVEELGLSDQVLPVKISQPAARNMFVCVNGKRCLLPNGPGSFLKATAPFTKSLFAVGCSEPFRGRKQVQDETVYDFCCRRFNEEVVMYIADPLCRALLTGDARKLSMKSCYPPPFQMEQQYGSLVMGMIRRPKDKTPDSKSRLVQKYKSEQWAMWSLRQGLEQIPLALGSYLEKRDDVEVNLTSPCTQLRFGDNKVSVQYNNRKEEVDHVFSCLPAYSLAALVEEQHPVLSQALQSIPFVSIGVVNLLYEGNVLPAEAFGHMVPSTEPSKILIMYYESVLFPDHSSKSGTSTRLSAMLGGSWFEELFGDPDTVDPGILAEACLQAARDQMNITAEPKQLIVNLNKRCVPQYIVGHDDILQKAEDYIGNNKLGLSLAGASYRSASIIDCVRNAKAAVKLEHETWMGCL